MEDGWLQLEVDVMLFTLHQAVVLIPLKGVFRNLNLPFRGISARKARQNIVNLHTKNLSPLYREFRNVYTPEFLLRPIYVP